MFNTLKEYIYNYCQSNECLGIPNQENGNCYKVSKKAISSVKDFYVSFPIITLTVGSEQGVMKWYPSEYFYKNEETSEQYTFCLAIDPDNKRGEIMLGGTFMRQNNFVFDPIKSRVGYIRASCSPDPN